MMMRPCRLHQACRARPHRSRKQRRIACVRPPCLRKACAKWRREPRGPAGTVLPWTRRTESTMAEPEVGKLQIHVRRIVSSDGTLESANEVYCPQRDRSMQLNECEACDDYGGSGLEHDGKRNYVLCRRLTCESARTLRSARHA